jgi:hypothetical protein
VENSENEGDMNVERDAQCFRKLSKSSDGKWKNLISHDLVTNAVCKLLTIIRANQADISKFAFPTTNAAYFVQKCPSPPTQNLPLTSPLPTSHETTPMPSLSTLLPPLNLAFVFIVFIGAIIVKRIYIRIRNVRRGRRRLQEIGYTALIPPHIDPATGHVTIYAARPPIHGDVVERNSPSVIY